MSRGRGRQAASRIGEVVGLGECLTAIAVGPLLNRGRSLIYRCTFCGSETAILPSNAKKYASCGCQKSASLSVACAKHGMHRTRTYKTWRAMLARCERPEHTNYRYYGGAGVTICEEWHSFERFFADMGERPSPAHTIDRIEGATVYSKETCRWATPVEQAVNRSSTVLLTIYGKTMCVAHWAKIGCNSSASVHQRLKHGWPARAAVFAPKGWRLTRWTLTQNEGQVA